MSVDKLQDKTRIDTQPMFDTARFARYLECAYATMWERQQRGDAPAGFRVPPIP